MVLKKVSNSPLKMGDRKKLLTSKFKDSDRQDCVRGNALKNLQRESRTRGVRVEQLSLEVIDVMHPDAKHNAS